MACPGMNREVPIVGQCALFDSCNWPNFHEKCMTSVYEVWTAYTVQGGTWQADPVTDIAHITWSTGLVPAFWFGHSSRTDGAVQRGEGKPIDLCTWWGTNPFNQPINPINDIEKYSQICICLTSVRALCYSVAFIHVLRAPGYVDLFPLKREHLSTTTSFHSSFSTATHRFRSETGSDISEVKL